MGAGVCHPAIMKLYPNLDVEFTYQNFGSAWLGILRGASEQIELAFNGLFNLCATNGEHEFQDHLRCVSVFWSSRNAMRRFFFNQYYMPRFDACQSNGKLVRSAMRHALRQIETLSQTCHEDFMNFDNQYAPDTYVCGQITAEKPDSDMKDAILLHAYADKENTKNVDNV